MRFAIAVLAIVLSVGAVSLYLYAADAPPKGNKPMPPAAAADATTVKVRLMQKDGTLTGPVEVPKVIKSDDEWRKQLTPEQFRILRSSGTERPFCGPLLDNKKEGVYACAGCGLPLFLSSSKFNSGTGWPSFFQPIAPENVASKQDLSHGMVRTESNCARCDGHLGHVFDDGPRPTGLRFCMNSESLKFVEQGELASLAEPVPAAAAASGNRAEAVFAGGCFWCVEAVFEELEGVIAAVSGYAGGTAETANYEAVCSGTTGHAEVVKIVYDPSKVSYEQLLKIHFATHDPTTLNRQGNDAGPQYRSSIFYASEAEKAAAERVIRELTEQKKFPRPIVTKLEPLTKFYDAERYHQDYACNNPNQGYIRAIAMPKVEKVRKEYKDMLKATPPQPAGK